jgi:uncharacterized protein YndB with AHSA1/START domain
MAIAERRSESKPLSRASMERVSDTELVWRHTFRASATIVFDAWTKPEFVRRWWAPKSRGVEMVQCEADLRVGGAYVYVLARGGAVVATFSGTYLEITRPTRLVYTSLLAPFPDAVRVTVSFEERDGLTDLVSNEVYPSKKVLDGAIASGMESGALETMELLAELVVSL